MKVQVVAAVMDVTFLEQMRLGEVMRNPLHRKSLKAHLLAGYVVLEVGKGVMMERLKQVEIV